MQPIKLTDEDFKTNVFYQLQLMNQGLVNLTVELKAINQNLAKANESLYAIVNHIPTEH